MICREQRLIFGDGFHPLFLCRRASEHDIPLPTANGRILSCAYSGNGKMALIVLNDTDAKHDITVKIPAELQKKICKCFRL